jgi:hypothetical protein
LFFIDLSRFHELSSEYDRLIEVGSIQSIYVFVLIFNKKNNVLIFFKLVNTYKLHNFPIALIKLTCSSPLVFFQSTSIVVMLHEWEHIETQSPSLSFLSKGSCTCSHMLTSTAPFLALYFLKIIFIWKYIIIFFNFWELYIKIFRNY